MKRIIVPLVAALGLGFAACTAESSAAPPKDQNQEKSDTAKAKTVSYKIDGMT